MIPLSLAHLTVLDVAPSALFDLAAEAGYQSVGIRILPAAPGAISYPLSRATVVAWRRRMADAGVGIHDVEFIPLTPEVRVEAYASTLALAAELGAKRINVSGDDADFERLRFRVVGTLHQALDIVQRAHRPNGRLLIDLLHVFRSGGTPEMLRDVPSSALGSLQLSDAPRSDPTDAGIVDEARQGRLFPGEGELPLAAYLDALPRGIPVGAEVPTGSTHPELRALERAAMACTASRRLLAAWEPMR
jgi:sugar phosphate isomerase/epimerase